MESGAGENETVGESEESGPMTDEMPSQAEGERDEELQEQIPDEPDGRHAAQPGGHPEPHQTPSQAEGERDEGPA